MEGTEGEFQDEARKLQIAIRCAKAAFLLSSLKSSVNRVNDEPEVIHKSPAPRQFFARICVLTRFKTDIRS